MNPATHRPLHQTRPLQHDCWICQNLREPANLVFYESPVSIGKLNPDQYFHGYSFVTLRWHSEELYQLSDRDRKRFLEDMSKIANALARALRPDKMNYELLGNGMPHLHWHLVPRYKTDPLWGRPIWTGSRGRKRLSRDDYDHLVARVKAGLTR